MDEPDIDEPDIDWPEDEAFAIDPPSAQAPSPRHSASTAGTATILLRLLIDSSV